MKEKVLFIGAILSVISVILTGKSIEENIHDKYFSSEQVSQQETLETNQNTEDKITVLTENTANNEIQTFSNDKEIDNYKTPIGKQIFNILRVVILVIAFSLIFCGICCAIFKKDDDSVLPIMVFFIILFSIIVCIYNIFFLKYKFIVNNQYSIESMAYTDNIRKQIKIVGYDGNNYSTIECPVEALMVKKSDLTVLVKYKYKPKNNLGTILEWKARKSEVNVLYLDDNYYSTNIDDIIDKFNKNSDNNIEDIKKDFAAYMQNSNLKFAGDHCVSATFLKIIIIAAIIVIIYLLFKMQKKAIVTIVIIAAIIFFVPVVMKVSKSPVYNYNIENTYRIENINHDEDKPDIYVFDYLVGNISENISVNCKDTQIIEMSDINEAHYIYKCKKKTATIFDWFAEGISKSRTIYVIK